MCGGGLMPHEMTLMVLAFALVICVCIGFIIEKGSGE